MAVGDNGIPAITEPWPVKDVSSLSSKYRPPPSNMIQIVYVSIVGTVMMAAFLEWFLWLAAFQYCIVKIYQKAEHYTIRILAVIVSIGFILLRFVRP